jgi:ATP-dependent DNA ligase
VPPPGIGLVPVTEDAPALWDASVGLGGEGSVLKERTAPYRPGVRSTAWLKLKPKLSFEVLMTGGSAERIRWGDWGEAVMLALRYTTRGAMPTWRSAKRSACLAGSPWT